MSVRGLDLFARNDLQKVMGGVEKAPGLKRAPTRSEKAKAGCKEALEGIGLSGRLFYGTVVLR